MKAMALLLNFTLIFSSTSVWASAAYYTCATYYGLKDSQSGEYSKNYGNFRGEEFKAISHESSDEMKNFTYNFYDPETDIKVAMEMHAWAWKFSAKLEEHALFMPLIKFKKIKVNEMAPTSGSVHFGTGDNSYVKDMKYIEQLNGKIIKLYYDIKGAEKNRLEDKIFRVQTTCIQCDDHEIQSSMERISSPEKLAFMDFDICSQ